MTPIVDYLTNFEHVARIKLQELAKESETVMDGCVGRDTRLTEQYRCVVKDYVRFRWITYLGTVKNGPLTPQEFSIGLTSFETLYRL